MSQFLFYYVRPEPPTWVFLSTFLVIGLFVMFHRFWSMRNLDVLLILAFTPGLMMVYEGRNAAMKKQARDAQAMADTLSQNPTLSPNVMNADSATQDASPATKTLSAETATSSLSASTTAGTTAQADAVITQRVVGPTVFWTPEKLLYWGFLWLIVCAGLLAIRMLLDTAIVRRPLLDPNLSSGGMLFLGSSLLLFLMANVATSSRDENRKQGPDLGPGYVLLSALPQVETIPERAVLENEQSKDAGSKKPTRRLDTVARVLAIGANLTLVFCIIAIGYWHFGNLKTGVGAATFYLLLPYTAHMTGRVDHVVPGALLLLAVLLYRQPFVAGLFLGCAAGVMYYPFSLLPLWCSFYWQRGIRRFTGGFLIAVFALVIAMIILHPTNLSHHLGHMFGIKSVVMDGMDGIWGLGWHPIIRLPIIVLFVVLSLSFVLWPAQKNLATLLSCSAALMAATQFWHGFGGGLYMAWFIPLAMLTIFRPNLDYCIALEVVRPTRRSAKVSPPSEKDPPTLAAAG